MRCENCKSEWNTQVSISQIKNCPFCGKPLIKPVSNSSAPDTLDGVLREIYQRFGYGVLLDKSKFISVFSDLAPDMKSERRLINSALELGIAKLFVNVPVSQREASIRQSIRELEDVLAEKAICTLLSALIRSLDWDEALMNLLPMTQVSAYDEKPDESRTSVQADSHVTAETESDSIQTNTNHQMKAASDITISGIQNEEKIEINMIESFSNDHGDLLTPTMFSQVYLQSFVKAMGLRVWFSPLSKDTDAELHWRIYKEIGTRYIENSEEIIYPVHLAKGSVCTSHALGYEEAGHWAVGNYKIVAYFKNAASRATTCFTINPGDYDKVDRIDNVRLFQTRGELPPLKAREYTHVFHSSSLSCMHYEAVFGKTRKNTYTYMCVKVTDPNHNIFQNIIQVFLLSRGDESTICSWGWSEPGNWQKGRYTYEISLYGSNTITGIFDVL